MLFSAAWTSALLTGSKLVVVPSASICSICMDCTWTIPCSSWSSMMAVSGLFGSVGRSVMPSADMRAAGAGMDTMAGTTVMADMLAGAFLLGERSISMTRAPEDRISDGFFG